MNRGQSLLSALPECLARNRDHTSSRLSIEVIKAQSAEVKTISESLRLPYEADLNRRFNFSRGDSTLVAKLRTWQRVLRTQAELPAEGAEPHGASAAAREPRR